jgi:hypothetical protein
MVQRRRRLRRLIRELPLVDLGVDEVPEAVRAAVLRGRGQRRPGYFGGEGGAVGPGRRADGVGGRRGEVRGGGGSGAGTGGGGGICHDGREGLDRTAAMEGYN